MIDLHGKSALVTGGSRGIGRATSLLLARAGARVGVNYRIEAARANEVVQEIREAGGEAFAVAGDVSRRPEAECAVEEAVSRFGSLDILVNNAGIWKRAPVDEMTDDEWEEMVSINVTGTLHCVRAAVPHMKRAGFGRIVNVSSTAGQRGEAFHSHYAASKGALISMTKSWAVELAGDGLTVNCVAPGWTETDMTTDALDGSDRDAILGAIPLGRVARADEIAGAILFLVSDLATFVTGEVLNVNGGAVLIG